MLNDGDDVGWCIILQHECCVMAIMLDDGDDVMMDHVAAWLLTMAIMLDDGDYVGWFICRKEYGYQNSVVMVHDGYYAVMTYMMAIPETASFLVGIHWKLQL